jgi:hypothetical protein
MRLINTITISDHTGRLPDPVRPETNHPLGARVPNGPAFASPREASPRLCGPPRSRGRNAIQSPARRSSPDRHPDGASLARLSTRPEVCSHLSPPGSHLEPTHPGIGLSLHWVECGRAAPRFT